MARITAAKLIKVETERTNRHFIFSPSAYQHIANWEYVYLLDGEWNRTKKIFVSRDRKFQVHPDFSADEITK